jgi:hypothetical protein
LIPGCNALAQFLPHSEQDVGPKCFKGRARLLFHVEETRGLTEKFQGFQAIREFQLLPKPDLDAGIAGSFELGYDLQARDGCEMLLVDVLEWFEIARFRHELANIEEGAALDLLQPAQAIRLDMLHDGFPKFLHP